MNSTAVFTTALPEKVTTELEKMKETNPHKYEEALRKAQEEHKERLKTLPFYKRTLIGDASEIALMKFF